MRTTLINFDIAVARTIASYGPHSRVEVGALMTTITIVTLHDERSSVASAAQMDHAHDWMRLDSKNEIRD